MFSYHNHSVFSDGAVTPEEMIRAAIAAGLTEVGLSDHYTLLPGFRPSDWSMPPERLGEYFGLLADLRERYASEIIVRLGVETDYFPETMDRVLEDVAAYCPDYVIGSVHYYRDFPIDECAANWEKLSADEADRVIEGYWKKIILMARDGRVNIAGHLDLYKKFGRFGSADFSPLIKEALEAVRDSGLAMEINTAGLYKPAGEFYPSFSIVRQAAALGIPMLVSADAHDPRHLDRSFGEALRQLQSLGIEK
ncbi:MAG: histidinol-phosphatase, partial [Abditibacteriota bacterium]|nr:histidinol-phosphatase [Abditibacteriota bacterium]